MKTMEVGELKKQPVPPNSVTLERLHEDRLTMLYHLADVEATLTRGLRLIAHASEEISPSLCEEAQKELGTLRTESDLSSYMTRTDNVNQIERTLIGRLDSLAIKLVSIVG